jgi:hypothetical protein
LNHSGLFLWTASLNVPSMLQQWATLSINFLTCGEGVHPQHTFCITENHGYNFAPEVTALNFSFSWNLCVSKSSLSPVWHGAARLPNCPWLFRPVMPHWLIHARSDVVSVNPDTSVCGVRSSALRPKMWTSYCNKACQTVSFTLAGKMLSCASILYIFHVCPLG